VFGETSHVVAFTASDDVIVVFDIIVVVSSATGLADVEFGASGPDAVALCTVFVIIGVTSPAEVAFRVARKVVVAFNETALVGVAFGVSGSDDVVVFCSVLSVVVAAGTMPVVVIVVFSAPVTHSTVYAVFS